MERYRTIKERASAEQIIEKSRFIAHISPAETKEAADAFIAEIKASYKDATHNVPAMVIGESQQIQWASDDGEPQGTSGAPMVQLIVSEGLTNVVVVVTRYFGGVKRGTGGLVRAYSSSARLAIDKAGICSVCDIRSLRVDVDYSSYEKIKRSSAETLDQSSTAFIIEDAEYTDRVGLTLLTLEENGDSLAEMIVNMTGGKARMIGSETVTEKMW